MAGKEGVSGNNNNNITGQPGSPFKRDFNPRDAFRQKVIKFLPKREEKTTKHENEEEKVKTNIEMESSVDKNNFRVYVAIQAGLFPSSKDPFM